MKRMPRHRRFPLQLSRSFGTCLLVSLLLGGSAFAQLLPVPEPSLETVEAAVREQLDAQRRDLDSRIGVADDATLGALFGGMGELYLTYDLVEAAEPCFINADQLAPSFRWRYLLGSLYQLDNRLEPAKQALESALELDERNGATLIRLGTAYLREENHQQARIYFERAAAFSEFTAAANYGLGQIAADEDQLAEAIRLFDDVLLRQPSANVVHYQLGQAYRRSGDREKMQFHLGRRGDQKVPYPDPIARELQNAATGVGAWLTLGRMSLSSGLFDIAEERFRKAVSIDPQSSAAHRSLANALQKLGRLREALAEYEQAILLEPQNAGLRYFVSQILVSARPQAADGGLDMAKVRSNNQRAVEHLRAALSQADDYLPGWVELAGALERSGDVAGAEQATGRALELRPGAADLQIYRASLLANLDREAEAKALLLTLEEAPFADREAEFRLARLLEQLGESDRAMDRYRSLATRPLANGETAAAGIAPVAWFRLGNLLVQRGELADAERAFLAAIEIVPSMTEALFNLGTILGRQGRFLDAAAQHANVVAYDGQNKEARYAQAMALVLGGEYGEARARLQAAVELFPTEPLFAHLLARVVVASPDQEVRNAAMGIELAGRLMDAFPGPDHAETLAMAMAESGDFERAIVLQRKVVEGLEERNAPTAAAARGRLTGYERGEPARSPWVSQ